MRYMVERNFVRVVGRIWMPGVDAAYEYPLSAYDIENIGEFTRESVEYWLALNTGDFQEVTDFYATVGDAEIPWAYEESEFQFNDCMYPVED